MAKKFCISFLCVSLSLLLICAGTVYIIDPFNHYRASRDMTEIIYQHPVYQNIGIAKYTEFDTLITGSSMTENFRANWFDDATGSKAIRLSYQGGLLPDYIQLFNTAIQYQKELRDIYFGLDNYAITMDTQLENVKGYVPSYLTDNNPFTDVNYLLNRDVLFRYLRLYFSYKNYPDYSFHEAQASAPVERDSSVYNRKNTMDSYHPPETDAASLPEDAFFDFARSAADQLCAIIRQTPDIRYTIFAPPYSILYWKDLQHNGKLDATLAALHLVYAQILQFDNVRMFYFQDDLDRITDLDNYKDFSHYCTAYNLYMLDCFSSGEKQIDLTNYDAVLSGMKEIVLQFDESQLYADYAS